MLNNVTPEIKESVQPQTASFETLLNRLKDAIVTKADINDKVIALSYSLNGEVKPLFITHSILVAACQYVIGEYFKSTLESLSGSHTSHKTLY